MQAEFFKKVVVPMLAMANVALICISSLGDSTNYYSRLVSKVDRDGKPCFNVIRFTLACGRCEKTSEPWRCTHKLGEIPWWQNEERQKVAKLMLEDDGNIVHAELMCPAASPPSLSSPRAFARAHWLTRVPRGGLVDGTSRVFSRELVARVERAPLLQLTAPISHVFVSIDPNGGGASKFAIASMYYQGPSAVVRLSHATQHTRACACVCAGVSVTVDVRGPLRLPVRTHHIEGDRAQGGVGPQRDVGDEALQRHKEPARLRVVLRGTRRVRRVPGADKVAHRRDFGHAHQQGHLLPTEVWVGDRRRDHKRDLCREGIVVWKQRHHGRWHPAQHAV
jgi:hypothetical protein